MNGQGFMDGYTDLPLPAGWRPGQYVIEVKALCCPNCASIHVSQRDNGKGEAYVWWECHHCAHRFRLPRGIGVKAYLNS
jgi:hypothetical protein